MLSLRRAGAALRRTTGVWSTGQNALVPDVFGGVGGLSMRWLATKEMKVPSMGDSITEGTILEWEKGDGDWANMDDVIAVVETDKVTVEIRAEQDGFIRNPRVSEGDVVEVGAPLCDIEDGERPEGAAAGGSAHKPSDAGAEESSPSPPPSSPSPPPSSSSPPPPPASSSPPSSSPPAASPPSSAPAPAPVGGERTETRVKMSRMRARIAERLKDAQNTAAMLTTFQECDMSALMEMRSRHKDEFLDKHGVKLGFMSPFIKAAASSLLDIPAINASIDGGDIVYRDYVDVSVAVASPRGLVVPVIRDAHAMSFAEVEQTLAELAQKARDNQIALEDMAGGTFTISNGGVFGSLMGTPILNPPQSAILGMHATKERAVVVNGQVQVRPVQYLALTYDHRIVDGREAVTFLKSLRDKIEDPTRILLDL